MRSQRTGRWIGRFVAGLLASLALAYVTLVIYAGWGHWGFYLDPPDVARRASIEEQYGELLALLREHIRRLPTAGAGAVEDALRADPRVRAWCERPELLGVALRTQTAGVTDSLYVHGIPTSTLNSEWGPAPWTWLTTSWSDAPYVEHGRGGGLPDYEYAGYNATTVVGETRVRIELVLDLLQLQGMQGLECRGLGGMPTDPRP
jgi:hypothetical protein